MQIRTLKISGLRSIESAELAFDDVTVLIGGNNAGKSTLLHALRLFFEAAPKLSQDDFYKREAETIEIAVTFDNLTESEVQDFGSAVHDGQITISRTFSNDTNSNLSYSVLAKTYPAFAAIRAESNKTQMRAQFNELADQIEGLERAANANQVLERMADWEEDHADELELSYVRGFFGAPNVANGKLRKKTGLHFVPAVANVAEETSDTKKSPIIALLADIARQTYENRQEVKEFIEQTQESFGGLVAPEKFPQLSKISESLTSSVQKYYGDSRLLAEWQSSDGIEFNFPRPVIRVEDGGFLSGLEHVGHGLQRAALFSVIEFLAKSDVVEDKGEFEQAQSDIILLIEEPEIYQHPHKQKLVSNAFRMICKEFSKTTGIRFQVVFATHSEKFLDVSEFHTARIVRKEAAEGKNKHSISAISVAECSAYFAGLVQKEPMSDEAFLAKLHIFSRELCEGFFAQKVVLVEGVTDKAVLEGVYRSMGRDSVAEGIVIASVDGKTKMDKPFYIFKKLGIPTYAVFDSDENSASKKTKVNHYLQAIAEVEKTVEFPHGCFDQFAAFGNNLESYMKGVCGEAWQETFKDVAEEFGLDTTDICKTPLAVEQVVSRLRAQGVDFAMLEEVICKVDELSA
jgi:predicted ATP-dependent endonuclease of OLD family